MLFFSASSESILECLESILNGMETSGMKNEIKWHKKEIFIFCKMKANKKHAELTCICVCLENVFSLIHN